MLEQFRLGGRLLELEIAREEQSIGRELTMTEMHEVLEKMSEKGLDSAGSVVRVIVYESPVARLPLTRDIFTGRYDERFGPVGDHMERVSVGQEILRLEEMEKQFVKSTTVDDDPFH